ncbi:MAG: outer membrane beta-barrel protein [Bacteroidota bacterium]|nr:outer membrane beta-barrel protein [Bacteroidota bacterium]
MKKTIGIVLVLLSMSCFAQRYPSFLSIRSGISLPAKKFLGGKSTLENGFALMGSASVVEAAYFYNKNVGLGALFSFNVNPVDKKRYADQFVKNNERFSNVSIESEPYLNTTTMFGFYFDLPLKRTYVAFTAKILAGFIWARNPRINFHFEYSDVAAMDVYQYAENMSKFTLYHGVGVRLMLNKLLSAKLNFDYTGTRFKFNYSIDRKSGKTEKQLSYMALTIGVAYSLY